MDGSPDFIRPAGWLYGSQWWQAVDLETGNTIGPRVCTRHDAAVNYQQHSAATAISSEKKGV